MKPEQKDYTKPEVFLDEMNSRNWEPRPTTRSARAEFLDNNYAYVNMGGSVSQAFASFRRKISFINPFAIQQGSTNERVGFGPHNKTKWWTPSALPNDVVSSRLLTPHFDPLQNSTLVPPDTTLYQMPLETFGDLQISKEPIPLSCVRPLQKFYRCRMINGEDKCQEEADYFLSICPNTVINELRNQKLRREKHRLIQVADYRKAIQVSDYNKDRSVAEVPLNVNYLKGNRHNLRPDTIWADERYSNVTQEEIEEARKLVGEHQKKVASRINPVIQEMPHVDTNKQFVKPDNIPIYVK